MANVRISNLTELTGSPVGTYIVVNNSGEDTTYKMERSNFISPISTFSPTYGMFSQTATTSTISGTSEQSIIGSGAGSLSIPANGFSVGDTFRFNVYGHLSNGNNEFNIRIKEDLVTLAETGNINYSTSGEETLFQMELVFVIKAIGGAGVAEIDTKGNFYTIKNSNFTTNGYSFESTNNTDFDTTVGSTLNVTVQFDTSASDTYMYTEMITLQKIY
jgi:hypothetical protein